MLNLASVSLLTGKAWRRPWRGFKQSIWRKTRVMLHGVPLYISKDNVGFFYSKFGEVADMSTVKRKARIATGDVEVMLTVNRKHFMEITNILTRWKPSHLCGCWRLTSSLLGLQGRWASSEVVPGKKTQPHPQPNTTKETAVPGTCPKPAKSPGDLTEGVKKGGKLTTNPQQQDVPN